ncbi:MAG TPA: murein biosynthesis integral membrane protein MurJ [Candidatus Limnocylindrales bacterium]|nr:murein biosynthesis integral membrane protein MurJ [Candidatus Limnocylindrales bacterium]
MSARAPDEPDLETDDPSGDGIEPMPSRASARTLARAGLVVSGAYLVSRILGYLRVLIVTATFGAGQDLDAFNAAFRIPDLIFQLVAAGAVASALVPMVGGLLEAGESQRAWRVISTIANLMLLGLAVLAAIAFVAAPALVAAITPGFAGPELDKTIELTRVMLAAPILLAMGSVATSALNADHRFAASAVAPIVYNLAIIAGALFLSSGFGVDGLAIGVVLGSLGHVLVQLPSMFRAGFRYTPAIDLGDGDARRTLLLIAPRVLGLGVSQITLVVMVSLASSLGQGAVTDFTVAFTLLQIPLGVIGIPLGIVIFPSLARELAVGRIGSYLQLVSRSLRVLLYVMLPIAALGMVLRVQVVQLLLGYGRFDHQAVLDTAGTLLLFLIGLAAHGSIGILARAFYARQDTRTPVIAAILAVAINTTLGVVLVGRLGLPALGLAIAIAAWAEAIALVVILARRQAGLDLGGITWLFVRSIVASAAAALVAVGVLAFVTSLGPPDPGKVVVFVQATLTTIAGGLVYLALSLALRIPEVGQLLGIALDLVRRRGPAAA